MGVAFFTALDEISFIRPCDPRTDLDVHVQQHVYTYTHNSQKKAHVSVKLETLSASIGVSSTILCSSKRFLYTVAGADPGCCKGGVTIVIIKIILLKLNIY